MSTRHIAADQDANHEGQSVTQGHIDKVLRGIQDLDLCNGSISKKDQHECAQEFCQELAHKLLS